MQIRFLMVLVGLVILSTPVKAVVDPGEESKKTLENMGKIHQFNSVFDDYSSGGLSYEPYNSSK